MVTGGANAGRVGSMISRYPLLFSNTLFFVKMMPHLPTLYDPLWCQYIQFLIIQHCSHLFFVKISTIAPQQHFPGRSILGLLTSATSRTAMDMSLPLGSTMSSPLERWSPVPFVLYNITCLICFIFNMKISGQQAVHLAAQGQGSQAVHCRGEGQEARC